MRLYRGEFLSGLHVPECAELSQWLDSQRARLRQLAAGATWSLADAQHARGATRDAVESARNAVRLAPDDEPGVRRLIALLDAAGDRAGALQAYERYARWLGENFGVPPTRETIAAVDAVRNDAVTPAPERERAEDPRGARRTPTGAPADRPQVDRARLLRRVVFAVVIVLAALGLQRMTMRSDAATARPADSPARLAYLKGRNQLGKGTLGALQDARALFSQAVDLDPAYAPAYVGLADVYNRFAIDGIAPRRDVSPGEISARQGAGAGGDRRV